MAVKNAFEKISLQFVKRIQIQFCPWEESASETRTFLSIVGANKVRDTNPNCKFKTVVKHDGTPPQVLVDFVDGKKMLFKSEHLVSQEMVKKLAAVCRTKDAEALPSQ